MTHAALIPLLGREFDDFLFASIGDDRNGPSLSVFSALARLDVDPWKEAGQSGAHAQGTGDGATDFAHRVVAEGRDGKFVARTRRRELLDCAFAASGRRQCARRRGAASGRPHSANATVHWGRRSRSPAACLLHTDGSSFKCARTHSGLARYDKRVCGATLGVRRRGGASRSRRLARSRPSPTRGINVPPRQFDLQRRRQILRFGIDGRSAADLTNRNVRYPPIATFCWGVGRCLLRADSGPTGVARERRESTRSGLSPFALPRPSNCEKFTNASERGSQFESSLLHQEVA